MCICKLPVIVTQETRILSGFYGYSETSNSVLAVCAFSMIAV